MCSRLTLAMVAVAGVTMGAQRPYPVYTEYHLDRTMTAVGRNFDGATASLTDGQFETAKQRFARTREQIAVSITFWRHKEKDDAIRMLRSVTDTLDELDAALSAKPVESALVRGLADRARAACEMCHAVYRDQDPVSQDYRLKPGSV